MRPSGCNDGIKKKKEQQKLPDNLRQKQHTYILAVQNYKNNTKEKTEKDKKKKTLTRWTAYRRCGSRCIGVVAPLPRLLATLPF